MLQSKWEHSSDNNNGNSYLFLDLFLIKGPLIECYCYLSVPLISQNMKVFEPSQIVLIILLSANISGYKLFEIL